MEKIENANAESLRRMLHADPVLVDVQPAGKVVKKGLGEGVILLSGPPIAWERMCGPMQGAVCGIAVFEGWADNLRQAQNAAAAGRFTFHPNHHFGAVGPMTGMTTISQPVFIVEPRAFGNRAFCTINEGLGKVCVSAAMTPRCSTVALDRRRSRSRAFCGVASVRRHPTQRLDRTRARHGRRDAPA